MNPSQLSLLKIDPETKHRPSSSVRAIFAVVALAVAAAVWLAWPRPGSERRVIGTASPAKVAVDHGKKQAETPAPSPPPSTAQQSTRSTPGAFLTVSGYIVTRERIEVSPRFQGVVTWIGVKKGDPVQKDQVVVRLEDAEQRARVNEVEGRLAAARVALEKAELNYRRVHDLFTKNVMAQDSEDTARLAVPAAKANIQEIEGQLSLARTYLEWTVIRSPISGVVLEKLVEPGELVTPQSFGGTRGPSTALIAVADPLDLQVEIDVNESDLAKISLGGRCRVSPEAWPDKSYDGVVAEISPEANRQKGTLQIKVGIQKPDKFLTPELTAKVEFLP